MVLVAHKQFLGVLRKSHHLIRDWIQWFWVMMTKRKDWKKPWGPTVLALSAARSQRFFMILLCDRVHAQLQGGFLESHLQWPSHCSGRCHSHWCSELVSQKGKKIVTPGSGACFVHFIAQDSGHREDAQSLGNFHFHLYCCGWDKFSWLKYFSNSQIHHLGFLSYGLLVYQYIPVVHVGCADAQMFAAALLKLGWAIQQSWTIHSWYPIIGVIRRQVSSF